MSIDATAFPHLLDAIFASAPPPSLIALRAASRTFRDRADALLFSHIVVGVAVPGDAPGRGVTLGRGDRYAVSVWHPAGRLPLLPAVGTPAVSRPGSRPGSRAASPLPSPITASFPSISPPPRTFTPTSNAAPFRALQYTRTLTYAGDADVSSVPGLTRALSRVTTVRRLCAVTPLPAPTVVDVAGPRYMRAAALPAGVERAVVVASHPQMCNGHTGPGVREIVLIAGNRKCAGEDDGDGDGDSTRRGLSSAATSATPTSSATSAIPTTTPTFPPTHTHDRPLLTMPPSLDIPRLVGKLASAGPRVSYTIVTDVLADKDTRAATEKTYREFIVFSWKFTRTGRADDAGMYEPQALQAAADRVDMLTRDEYVEKVGRERYELEVGEVGGRGLGA